jgi:predicted nucleic acid-binding protein
MIVADSDVLIRLGVGIGMGDILIAGIVLAQGGTLLTRNRRHFERIPG